MNATLPPESPEASPSPIVREVLFIEPDLARLMPAREIDVHLKFFARLLRIGAEFGKRGES